MIDALRVHDEVAAALAAGRPVVALETAVVTHGLPATPRPDAAPRGVDGFETAPANLAAARAMAAAVRRAGAVPAIVGVEDGRLLIGMDDATLARFAADGDAHKAAVTNLAHLVATGRRAGTTVSATLAACARAPRGPIRVFATGGIGGVHPDWTAHPDVSADLAAIARTPVCVVSSGAKSVLDLAATLEALEALGVPVLGYRTHRFPRFHLLGSDALPRIGAVDSAAEAAAACRVHWDALGGGGVLLANPVPADAALDEAALAPLVVDAERAAHDRGVRGAARTPFVLAHIAEASRGATLRANVALLVANAALAGELAAALAATPASPP